MSEYDYGRYQKIQRLNRRKQPSELVTCTATDFNRKINAVGLMFFLILSIGSGAIFGYFYTKQAKPKVEFNPHSCTQCHNRMMSMIQYFERLKNPHPVLMAEAVLATKRPKLLAAIAVKGEKNTPFKVRKGGYKKAHAGAWQANEKYWGKVPNTPIGQALHADSILDDLTKENPLNKAISIYGGDSTDKYWKIVSAELTKVP